MTNANTTTPATVGEQGAHIAPAKASAKKQAIAKNDAPKARKSGKGAKPKKDARTPANAPKPQAGPRHRDQERESAGAARSNKRS
jgi:hypothetical protein